MKHLLIIALFLTACKKETVAPQQYHLMQLGVVAGNPMYVNLTVNSKLTDFSLQKVYPGDTIRIYNPTKPMPYVKLYLDYDVIFEGTGKGGNPVYQIIL